MISQKQVMWAEVDEQGRLLLPPEVAARYGLVPGARVRLDSDQNTIRLHRPVTQLTKIYIEPTTLCNLDCRTCIRNVWDEPMGRMAESVFTRILEGINQISPRPTVFIGGLGEPLFHPQTIAMVEQLKRSGARVELITNGTLLTEKRSRQLVAAGLDVLWVSIDGATPESYSDVRLGAALPKVLKNLDRFRVIRHGGHRAQPEIGIAFVAMKRNIADLPKVLQIARNVGAVHFKVSNVLPYTDEMRDEILYRGVIRDIAYLPSIWLPDLSLPKMEINEDTQEAFFKALHSGFNVSFAGNNFGANNDVCTFIESGSLSVGWDGRVSPCLPLLHSHVHHVNGRKRFSTRHVIGSVMERDLLELWLDPDYVSYRERVHSFAFAPCTYCGGCEMLEANQEDCLGNEFPVCGGCLWAQGVIQCP